MSLATSVRIETCGRVSQYAGTGGNRCLHRRPEGIFGQPMERGAFPTFLGESLHGLNGIQGFFTMPGEIATSTATSQQSGQLTWAIPFADTDTRLLARAGHRVVVERRRHDPSGAERSRFAAEVWEHASPARDEAWLDLLERFLAGRPDISLVFPVLDDELMLFTRHFDRLPRGVRFVMP